MEHTVRASDAPDREVDRPRREQAQAPRTAGMQARRALAALGGQASLMVGRANDPSEREADMIADAIMGRLAATPSTTQAAPAAAAQPTTRIRRRAIGAAGGTVDAETSAELEAERRGGTPLPGHLKEPMEQAFGADFSRVRLHTGRRSAELNRRFEAQAFTLGSDVFVRDAADLRGDAGRHLLAHELTHVVQQGGASQDVRRKFDGETDVGNDGAPESAPAIDEGDEGAEIGDVELPGIEVRKGPDDRADRANRRRRATGHRDGSGTPLEINLMGLSVSDRQVSQPTSTRADAVTSNFMPVFWHNPGNKSVEPFGEEGFNPSAHFVTWSRKKKGDPIKVSLLLKAKCDWGVDGGGSIDIKSGSSSKIKADNYQDIVDDLTPVLVEKSWRAPRDTYWSKKICERHEKFHSTDDRDWVKGAGKQFLTTWLGKQTIQADLPSKQVTSEVKSIVTDGLAELGDANLDFYTGGAGSYFSYAGEQRAFGDGRQPYLDLAAAVKKTGEKKKKAADKKAAKAGAGAP